MENHTLCICKARCFLCRRMVKLKLSKRPQDHYEAKIYDMLCGDCIEQYVLRVSGELKPGQQDRWGGNNDPQAN